MLEVSRTIQIKFAIIIFGFLVFFPHLKAEAFVTVISPNELGNQAAVCKDVACSNPGVINFQLVSPSIVIDSRTGITGRVWGNELGWINFNPTGQGVYFANPATGKLGGYAWSSVSGWINFGVTGQEVKIDPVTGRFNGWAWTGGANGGWIRFDCTYNNSCVRTQPAGGQNAAPLPSPTPPPIVDVCPNIDSVQQSIPQGYTVLDDGSCVPFLDVCPNLDGDQNAMPTGYEKDAIEACVPSSVDYCANISGNQTFIPAGDIIDNSGNCIKDSLDKCPSVDGVQNSYGDCGYGKEDACGNLPGYQSILPTHYAESNGVCYPATFDMCSNLDGNQRGIPSGYIVNTGGQCVIAQPDQCANIAGIQDKVPAGFYKSKDYCFFIEPYKTEPFFVNPSSFIKYFIEPFYVNPFSMALFSIEPFFVNPTKVWNFFTDPFFVKSKSTTGFFTDPFFARPTTEIPVIPPTPQTPTTPPTPMPKSSPVIQYVKNFFHLLGF